MSRNVKIEIAEWMLSKLENEGILYQETVVYEIAENYGSEYTYINENGNIAIDRGVLSEFRNLTENEVVWVRGDRYWRKREAFDSKDGRSTE